MLCGGLASLNRGRSEPEFVGASAVGEGEAGSEVSAQVLDLLDVLEQLGVHSLLHALQLFSELGGLGLSLLGTLKVVLGSVFELVLAEPGALLEEVVADVDVDAVEGHAGRGGEDVGGVDSAESDTVDCVGTSDEQVAGGEVLEGDHSATAVGSGKQHDD